MRWLYSSRKNCKTQNNKCLLHTFRKICTPTCIYFSKSTFCTFLVALKYVIKKHYSINLVSQIFSLSQNKKATKETTNRIILTAIKRIPALHNICHSSQSITISQNGLYTSRNSQDTNLWDSKLLLHSKESWESSKQAL